MAFDIDEVIGRTGRIVKEDNEVINEGNVLEGVSGKYSIELSGTDPITAPTGYYIFCIVPSSDMAISDQTDVSGAVNADLTAIAAHPKSTPIYTNLSGLTLTSGDGIAYLMKS